MEDFRTYAKEHGIAVSDVVARFGGQNEFIELVETLRARSDDLLVRAEWKDGKGTIHLRPGSEGISTPVVADANVNVVTVDQLGEKSQAKLAEQVSLAMERAGQDVFTVGFVAETGHLQVTAYEPVAPGLETIVKEAISGAAKSEASLVELELRAGESSMAPVPDARGGMNYSSCTGGFIAKSGSSRYVVTARHCETKPSTYDGATTGPTTYTTNRDLRRTYLSGNHVATFRWDWGAYRTVQSVGNPVFGTLACKFGTTTGSTCATVIATDQCASYDGYPTFCGMARVSGYFSEPGDSGGPWFSGTKALAIHSGRWGSGSVGTKISDISGLGVSLVTG